VLGQRGGVGRRDSGLREDHLAVLISAERLYQRRAVDLAQFTDDGPGTIDELAGLAAAEPPGRGRAKQQGHA